MRFIRPTFAQFSEEGNLNEEKKSATNTVNPLKDRSQIIPVETSIRYLQSDGTYLSEM